jgi:hypothetical protein
VEEIIGASISYQRGLGWGNFAAGKEASISYQRGLDEGILR